MQQQLRNLKPFDIWVWNECIKVRQILRTFPCLHAVILARVVEDEQNISNIFQNNLIQCDLCTLSSARKPHYWAYMNLRGKFEIFWKILKTTKNSLGIGYGRVLVTRSIQTMYIELYIFSKLPIYSWYTLWAPDYLQVHLKTSNFILFVSRVSAWLANKTSLNHSKYYCNTIDAVVHEGGREYLNNKIINICIKQLLRAECCSQFSNTCMLLYPFTPMSVRKLQCVCVCVHSWVS